MQRCSLSLSDRESLLPSDHLTAPCQRRYGDVGKNCCQPGCTGLHGGERREGEFRNCSVRKQGPVNVSEHNTSGRVDMCLKEADVLSPICSHTFLSSLPLLVIFSR